MRPAGVTAVASASSNPAPPTARAAWCETCHWFAKPSSLEYWHIGDIAMRLRKVTPRSVSGVNRPGLPRAAEGPEAARSGCAAPVAVVVVAAETPAASAVWQKRRRFMVDGDEQEPGERSRRWKKPTADDSSLGPAVLTGDRAEPRRRC